MNFFLISTEIFFFFPYQKLSFKASHELCMSKETKQFGQ